MHNTKLPADEPVQELYKVFPFQPFIAGNRINTDMFTIHNKIIRVST